MDIVEIRAYTDIQVTMFSTSNDQENRGAYLNFTYASNLYAAMYADMLFPVSVAQSHAVANVQIMEEHDTIDKSTDFSTFCTEGSVSIPLNDFFSRPVLLFEATLPNNNRDFAGRKFDPWNLWSKNPSVRSKLKNYYLFRGNMKLKFVFNSTRHHFGTLLISNQPFPGNNPTLLQLEHLKVDGVAQFNDALAFNTYLSQSPEVAYCKIGIDNNVEMTIPFVSPKPYWEIRNTNSAIVVDSASFVDFQGATEVYMSILNLINVANDDFNSEVSLQVYGWVEDVSLGPLTGTRIAVAQSASFKDSVNNNKTLNKVADLAKDYVDDEYADAGPVSKISSAAGNIANKVSDVPVIGSAAKATSTLFKGAAKLANHFGFSKPPWIEDPQLFRPSPGTIFSTTSGYDLSQKLSADPKQELALDMFGSSPGVDEMSLAYMCAKESFFHTILWQVTDVPRKSIIAILGVSPMRCVAPADQALAHTPLSFASLGFKYWRGDITYRFEIVASQYHRGKLLIVWEPNLVQTILRDPNVEVNMNTNYSFYVDLEKTRDFEITVGYAKDRAFAQLNDPSVPDEQLFQTELNGALIVRPLTELTSPSNSLPNRTIEINVYAKSNNMIFAGPTVRRIASTTGTSISLAQSMESKFNSFQPYAKQEGTSNLGVVTEVDKININNVVTNNKDVLLRHFGENIDSIRSLLKRAFPIANIRVTKSVVNGQQVSVLYEGDIYPPMIQIPRAPVSGTTRPLIARQQPVARTFATRNLFDLYRRAFLFAKGGFRHKFVFENLPSGGTCYVAHNYDNDDAYFSDYTLTQGVAALNSFPVNNAENFYDLHMNRVVEVEVPFYSPSLFLPANAVELGGVTDYFLTAFFPQNNACGFTLKANLGTKAVNENILIDHFGSIAEDFSFHRFQGAPVLKTDQDGFYVNGFAIDVLLPS